MLICVHQLVTNCFCLLFGAVQEVNVEFLRAYLLKTAVCGASRAMRVNQNSGAVHLKQEAETHKLNHPQVLHHDRHLSRCQIVFILSF